MASSLCAYSARWSAQWLIHHDFFYLKRKPTLSIGFSSSCPSPPSSSSSSCIKKTRKSPSQTLLSPSWASLLPRWLCPSRLLSVVAYILGDYNPHLIIGLFLILWASDTGAYFAGMRFGKRKLFERVSPKKSWEGSVGGAALSLLFAIGIAYFVRELAPWKWMFISLITVIIGTYGDLVESLFKRSMDIKDSGRKLPGHGGFLDRFDSLLLSIPFIIIFLKFFAHR